MTIRPIILSSTLLFSLPLFAEESKDVAQASKDVIVMKNGDRITGDIKGLNAGVLSVRVSYIDGRIAMQWSQIAHLESNKLYLVHTESGAVYTGKLSTSGESNDPPIRIEVAMTPERAVEIPPRKIISLGPTSDSFWHRFDGAINTGLTFSKGNESVQYNLSSQLAYYRERWTGQVGYNATIGSNSGAPLTTRNQTNLDILRLLRWNNWFYAGYASFLQSSVQELNLQTTLGAGVGRYLKNTNRASIYVAGGFGWQNAGYKEYTVDQGTQNTAVGFVATEIKAFKFKKTNLDITASVIPAITGPARVHSNTNASYYIKFTPDLSWNISFYGSWDSRPPATFSGADYGTSSGVSWSFGNR
jgi:putative salt-induced outer membrane protein YdiY